MYLDDDFVFVAVISRIGSKLVEGPVTKKMWNISHQGSWIAADDIAITETQYPYYCFKERKMLSGKIFYLTVPDSRQLMQKPKGD